VIEFQATDAILERTGVLYKTKRLSRVEKEDVMYRIKPSIFKLCDNMYEGESNENRKIFFKFNLLNESGTHLYHFSS
jgi:hypothetical protein